MDDDERKFIGGFIWEAAALMMAQAMYEKAFHHWLYMAHLTQPGMPVWYRDPETWELDVAVPFGELMDPQQFKVEWERGK